MAKKKNVEFKRFQFNFHCFSLHFVFALHRYRDDENDSDDEVDWEALAKAAKEYQKRNG